MDLVLVPTGMEADLLVRALERFRRTDLARQVRVIGFGPVSAAVGTSRLLSEARDVVLVGIAGTFDEARFPVGSATSFGRATLDGIGVGRGTGYQSAEELGFPQLDESGESLRFDDASADRGVLTVCASSADDEQARQRVEHFDGVMAEDMESYSVALACRCFVGDEPRTLRVVRGASNRVGDRETRTWRTREALESAARLLCETTEEEPTS